MLWGSIGPDCTNAWISRHLCYTSDTGIQPDIRSVIVQWSGTSGASDTITLDKVPTELLYNDGTILWGCQIPDSEPRQQWFKLSLCLEQKKRTSWLQHTYSDDNKLPPSYDYDCADLATDFLKRLVHHIIKSLEDLWAR
jgi:hypothetical protein